jgi:SNF2 family DNA or RNA helicase
MDFKCEKYDALKDLLETICFKHQVIVWTSFVHTYGKIADVAKELGHACSFVVGGQKTPERELELKQFELGETRVLVANAAAGGEGLNLQHASYMIYFSKTFNLTHNIQSEARAYRAGSERHGSVVRIDLLTKDTVEERIHNALEHKKKVQDVLLSYKRELVNG